MDALNMGVTSLRTVGVQEWADVALRDAFSAGKFKGPRLFCGGHALNTTAGHMADVDKPIDGPVAMVKAVRNEIMHYVNHIKLVTTGGIIGTGHDVMTNITWLRGEMEAALTIAKQRGVPAAVHATVPEAIKWAVSIGCRSIEHGYVMDEEAARMMADTGTYYVPTLALSHLTPEQADSEGAIAYCQHHPLPDEFRERANFFAPIHDESFRNRVGCRGQDSQRVGPGASGGGGADGDREAVEGGARALRGDSGGYADLGGGVRRGRQAGHDRARQVRRLHSHRDEPAGEHREPA